MSDETIFLVDNGSLEPAATLSLRNLAVALGERVGACVEPVSMRHSDRIPAEKLGGVAAETIEAAFARQVAGGVRRISVVPLFFGPSGAVTSYLPDIAHMFPDLEVTCCNTLYELDDGRLARIIAENVLETARSLESRGTPKCVALVDHGSPVRELTAVRDVLAREVGGILGEGFEVAPCSMERREGAEFDFNEPLLEKLLASEGWNSGDVIVALQFLQPGRHAGPDGDIARICSEAEVKEPGLRTHMTALVGGSPLLVEILADRLREGGPIL